MHDTNTGGQPQSEFGKALHDINGILKSGTELPGLATGLVNLVRANMEYQTVELQLQAVLVRREMIMRQFDSLDNFIRKAYEERAAILALGEKYIRKGVRRKNYDQVYAGLQIIKAVLMINPFNRQGPEPGKFSTISDAFAAKLL